MLLIAWLFAFISLQDGPPLLQNAWVKVTRQVVQPHAALSLRGDASGAVAVNLSTREVRWIDNAAAVVRNRTSPADELLVEIEPKPAPYDKHVIALDPARIDSAHHKVVFENRRVRVLRNTLEPHVQGAMHEHNHYLVVYLTDLHTIVTQADGQKKDNVHHRGDVTWRDYTKHATENIGDSVAEEVQIELN
jgi:hypothetical protein